MAMMNGVTRMARGAVIGLLAIGAATLMLPGTAEARPGPHQIAQRLDRIAYQVDRIPDLRGLYRKDAEIDRIQARLHRLERISEYQRGHRSRRNGAIIDRLQHRLYWMERRIEARIARREARRDHRDGYRRGYWHDHRPGYWRDHRPGYWGYRSPVIISRGFD